MKSDEFRAARKALGLTQAAMAAALESDLRTVQRWEAGERGVPGPVKVAIRLMRRAPTCIQDATAGRGSTARYAD